MSLAGIAIAEPSVVHTQDMIVGSNWSAHHHSVPSIPSGEDVCARASREAMHLVEAWLPRLLKLLRRALALPLTMGDAEVTVVDGDRLNEALGWTWTRFAQDSRKEPLVMSFGGRIIEYVESHLSYKGRIGSPDGPLFTRVGDLALSSLTIQSCERLGTDLRPLLTDLQIDDAARRLFSAPALVCISIGFTSPAPGRLIVAARPQSFVPCVVCS